MNEARLAALDRREDDVIAAVSLAIDRGMRWDGFLTDPVFDGMADNLAFRTELARMAELAEADRTAVLDLLCAPGSELSVWQPAPETCQLWETRQARSTGAPT